MYLWLLFKLGASAALHTENCCRLNLSKISHTHFNVRFRPRLVRRETTTQWSVDFYSHVFSTNSGGHDHDFFGARCLHYNHIVVESGHYRRHSLTYFKWQSFESRVSRTYFTLEINQKLRLVDTVTIYGLWVRSTH